MDKKEALNLALTKMDEFGLLDEGWGFKFSKSKSAAGTCYHRKKLIAISEAYVELNSREGILNTILHEIAHALLPSNVHHDSTWRKLFIHIGGNGSRTHSLIQPKGKYSYVCPSCKEGYEQYRGKPKNYTCGKCRGVRLQLI